MVFSNINIAIYRTRDMDMVKQLSSHPDIYHQIIDDGCPSDSADWQPKDNPRHYYLIPWLISPDQENIPLGIVAYYQINHILFDAHVFILPEYQHQYSVEIGQLTKQWMFDNTSCRKIIGLIPANKPHVLEWAKKCGMYQEGYLHNSISIKNKLIDQYIFTVEK